MKVINASYEIIDQQPGMQGIYDIIEIAGKTSYKSPVKGGEVAKKFVEERAKEGHLAVLEFGTIYLKIPNDRYNTARFYEHNPYSKVVYFGTNAIHLNKPELNEKNSFYCVTTNYRVILENNREKDLEFLCEPTEKHEKRYCVRFLIDRFTGEEFLRHRVFSFCRESTRFCNYSSDRFERNITYVLPPWLQEGTEEYNDWISDIKDDEQKYFKYIEKYHWRPEQARTLLNCAIKSPLVMCGFQSDWLHFFDLRVIGKTGRPHPQAKEVAEPLMNEMVERKMIEKEKASD